MNSEEYSRDKAIALLRAGYDRALGEAAAQYAMPICWIVADSKKPLITASGTAFILDAGQGPILVTANHVYEDFLHILAIRSDAVCVLGEVAKFPLRDRLIAQDSVHDVATFSLTAADIEQLGKGRHPKVALTGSQSSWPPKPPERDKGVFFVGFPGQTRSMRPYRGGGLVEVDWQGYSAFAIASSISDTSITIALEHDPELDIGQRNAVPAETDIGGCSGAPLLTLVESSGVVSWRLGGIINEASPSIVKAARADSLNPDGSINPHPDPNAYVRAARNRAERADSLKLQ